MARRQSRSRWDALLFDFTPNIFLSAVIGAVFGVVFSIIAPAVGALVFGSSPPWYHQAAFYGLLLLIFGFPVLIFSLLKRLERHTQRHQTEVLQKIELNQTELLQKVGLTVTYYDEPEAVFRAAKGVVSAAKRKILVLTSVINEEEVHPRASQEQDEYYEALLEKPDHGVEYTRIVQFTEQQQMMINSRHAVEQLKKNQEYLNHYRQILAKRKQKPALQGRLALRWVLAQRLSTFVLIDDINLLWQINEFPIPGQIDRMRMQGVFLIYDPNKVITQHFDEFFSVVLSNSEPMNENMLPT